MDSKLRLELYQRGYIARQTFDRLIGGSREMAGSLALAKRIAKYPTPVLLTGEQGVGKGMLAQCIHNESLRGGNAFVPVDCGAWQAETLDNRHVRLTQGAQKFIQEYDWPGNLDQMNNLCERVVLLTEKRNVDEVFLKKQLELVSPRLLPGTGTVVLYRDPKAEELAGVLRKHGGNREKAAEELGVSKTTLWRYMKKYGIGKDLSY